MQGASFSAVATSPNYGITISVLDAGGGSSESNVNQYQILGKLRDKAVNLVSSSNYNLAEGFLRSIYLSAIAPPHATSISPAQGFNDERISAAITGLNFKYPGVASVELRLAGQPTIVATNVHVGSDTTITCRIDLQGASPEHWSVYVNNNGYVSVLPAAFWIREAGLKIAGRPLNFPNPFNPDREKTHIRYKLTQDANIVINLYNIQGERVWHQEFDARTNGGKQGDNDIIWDALDVFSLKVPNGVYICQITTKNGKTLGLIKIAIMK